MKKEINITKKHGIIGAILAAVLAVAHMTHFPVLLLAFFGFVSAGIIESPLFKIIAIIITVVSVSSIMYLHTKKKDCKHKKES